MGQEKMTTSRIRSESKKIGLMDLLEANLTKVILGLLIIVIAFLITASFIEKGNSVVANLIISFFGILATFIVVSNYSQMSDLKAETQNQMTQQETRLSEMKHEIRREVEDKVKGVLRDLEKKTNKLETSIEALDGAITTKGGDSWIRVLKDENAQLNKMNDNLVDRTRLLMYLITGEHRNLLLTTFQGKRYRCKVLLLKEEYWANASIQDGMICFQIDGKNPTDNVSSVDGVAYDKIEIKAYLQIFNSIINNNTEIK